MTDAAPRSLAVVASAPAHVTRAPDVFEPTSLNEAMWLAKTFYASNLLPKGVDSPEAAFTVIVTGHELGLSPMASLRMIHVFDGKPILSAALIVGICLRRSDLCEYFTLVESSGELATYETKRRNNPVPTRLTFAMSEAQHLATKDNWKNNRPDMLRARCSAKLARAVYPDIVGGLYDPDELDEVRAAPSVPSIGQSIGVPIKREEIQAAEGVVAKLDETESHEHERLLSELGKGIDTAETLATLAAAADAVAKARAANRVTELERAALVGRYKARRQALREAAANSAMAAQTAPPVEPAKAPPSAPRVEADADGVIPDSERGGES